MLALLKDYSRDYDLGMHVGSWSKVGVPSRVLSVSDNRTAVQDEYVKRFPSLKDAAVDFLPENVLSKLVNPLGFDFLTPIWNSDVPTLCIARSGSDY